MPKSTQVVHDVAVNGRLVREKVIKAELVQAFERHTLAFVTVQYPRPYTASRPIVAWPETAPVAMRWGRAPGDVATWYGYVHHQEPATSAEGTGNVEAKYVLIGTSLVLNQEYSRNWTQVSDSYLARQLAKAHGFASVTDVSSPVQPSLPQNGSDFALLSQRANEVGFRFWCDGPVLKFLNPQALLLGTDPSRVPTFTLNKSIGEVGTIVDLQIMNGQMVPTSGVAAGRTVFGLDRRSGKVVQASATTPYTKPYLNKIATPRPIKSIGDAIQAANAVTTRNAEWLTATAVLRGTTKLAPGQVVALDGLGLPKGADGAWLVTSARHQLAASLTGNWQADSFFTEVELARNYGNSYIFSKIRKDPAQSVGVVLSNGIWQADRIQETIYGN